MPGSEDSDTGATTTRRKSSRRSAPAPTSPTKRGRKSKKQVEEDNHVEDIEQDEDSAPVTEDVADDEQPLPKRAKTDSEVESEEEKSQTDAEIPGENGDNDSAGEENAEVNDKSSDDEKKSDADSDEEKLDDDEEEKMDEDEEKMEEEIEEDPVEVAKRKAEEEEKRQEEERKRKEEEEVERKKQEEEKKKKEEERKLREEEEKKKQEEEKKRKEEEKKAAAEKRKKEEEERKAKRKLAELEKYWKPVKEDTTDFTGWMYLLQYVDGENEPKFAREAYNSFFERYPYCYGYWKKYADFERKKGSPEKCSEVFERGLKAIPLSVDLWIHYLNYVKNQNAEDDDAVRDEYKRAIKTVGVEFRSSKLWEHYIKWETEKKEWKNVAEIYNKLLTVPNQMYTTHFENFTKFVNEHHPKELLETDEFLDFRKEVLEEIRAANPEGELLTTGMDDDAPPGADDEDQPPGEGDSADITVKSDEEIAGIRKLYIAAREKVHKENEEKVSKRWAFEEGIKRPYFHVKPLEKSQLKNWKDYLDFEMEQGDNERIRVLFERCLIACAFYEEFWHKYARHLSSQDLDEALREVYKRACTIHLQKKPALHLQWAALEEKQGNYEAADEILLNMEKNVPDLLQLAYRRINISRRKGDTGKAEELFTHYIEKFKDNEMLAVPMTIKYARYASKVLNDTEKSKNILKESMKNAEPNFRIYLQLIDVGFTQTPVDEDFVVEMFNLALSSNLDSQTKLLFSQRKVEFLEDFGLNVQRLQESIEDHLKLLKSLKEEAKKQAEERAKSENRDDKKGRSDRGGSKSDDHSASAGSNSYVYSQPPPNSTGYNAQGYNNAGYNQGYQQPPAQSWGGNYNQSSGYNYQPSNSGGGYNQGWGNYQQYNNTPAPVRR